mgnify:CR=1 FL=1
MKGVYTDYFQKSKVFLYPLLRLQKGQTYVPSQTYVMWDNVYSANDLKFMCEYKYNNVDKFNKFSLQYLTRHTLFEDTVELDKNKRLFIFDFYSLKHDFNAFIKGKYSQFTLESKIHIVDFFGDKGKIAEYVHGFLSPSDVHDSYADFLGINVSTIQDVYEVCSPPDLEKETLVDNNSIIYELLKRDSISLEK